MTDTPAKRELFIGIDAYKSNTLDGCVNDVEMMRKLLIDKFAFPEKNTTLIKEADATRVGLLEAFDKLIDETGQDDVVVIHYAGHGSQMWLDPLEVQDEASGMKNTIVPIDRTAKVNRDITDDEINNVLERLAQKTSHITLIFDCCHSATITRAAMDEAVGKSRYIEPAERGAPRSASVSAVRTGPPQKGPSGWVPLADSYVLIAGCRDKEKSFETPPGKPKTSHGALSWSLHEALEDMSEGTTYRELFERVSPSVSRMYAGELQHPQLEGRIDREVFGVRVAEPMRFIPVKESRKGIVTLGAGAAMGIRKGTRWTVHRPDTKQPTSKSALGEVTISEVHAVESYAEVDAKAARSVVERCRAVEGEQSFGGNRLAVVIEAAAGLDRDVAAMKKTLGASPYLEIVTKVAPEVVRVRARSQSRGGEAVQYWEIETAAGPLMPPSPSLNAVDDIRGNLETIARYRHALSLENTESELGDKVTFTVKRMQGDGTWVTAEPNEDGVIPFDDGDVVGFSITNKLEHPVFVTLLDFSRSGAIGQLHPPRGAKEVVEPGVTFEIGTDPRKKNKITLQHEPYAIDVAETFKLVATTNEGDFWFLTQPGVRSAEVWSEAVEAGTKRGAASQPDEPEPPADDWTTVSRRYLVRPKETGA